MTDTSGINSSLNHQLPTNNSGQITAARLRTALTTGAGAGVLGLTAWIAATLSQASTKLQIGSQSGSLNFNGVLSRVAVARNGASLLNR